MPTQIEIEVAQAVKKLHSLRKELSKRELQKPLRESARILVKEARSNIPKHTKPHHRYGTSKVVGKIRAPKGFGRIVATYYPGNLRRSLQILTFRKSKNVFVGFKARRGASSKGTFKGRKFDGYYAVMKLELGQAPLRRAVNSTKTAMAQDIITRVTKLTQRAVNKL